MRATLRRRLTVQRRPTLRVIATTTDPVRLSFLQVLLADAGIDTLVLDAHISAIEGGIGAFPRRLAVATEDERRARAVLAEAGEDAT
jgi:hypothetical protein